MTMSVVVLIVGILFKGNDMEAINFTSPNFDSLLKIVCETEFCETEYDTYEILKSAQMKIGEQLVEITDPEILAEIMACKGYLASAADVATYEMECVA